MPTLPYVFSYKMKQVLSSYQNVSKKEGRQHCLLFLVDLGSHNHLRHYR